MKMAKEYVKLEDTQVFKRAAIDRSDLILGGGSGRATAAAMPLLPVNLMAYDGTRRIFVWNTEERLLHFVEVHHSSILDDTSADQPGCLFASNQYKTVKLSIDVTFQVRTLKFNRTGQLLLLAGDRAMVVVDVAPQSSQICRAGMVGDDMFNGRALRVLHVAWHPYSDNHIGVLSSDGVFRLFNLAADPTVAEQEYHLQIGLPSKPGLGTFARAVSFAFGGEHFWDRFSVFILFTDASIYALCPIVPFGSVYNIACVKDLARDASNTGAGPKETSNRAIVWLEIVFPDLADVGTDAIGTSSVLRARPQVPFNASLVLQGPLPKIWGGEQNEEKLGSCATSILYNTAGKDSILTVSTRNGELLFYALADEVQPMWNMESTPKLLLDDVGDLISVGMLVEPNTQTNTPKNMLVQVTVSSGGAAKADSAEISVGQTPPLLQLASIDLALSADAGPLGIFSDPLIAERVYCHHALGLDTVQLQWMPFSDGSSGKGTRPPMVSPVLDTSPTGDAAPMPLLGAAVVLNSFGETWLVVVTASGKCAVIEMKPQRPLPPLIIDEMKSESESKASDAGVLKLMSGDLLLGPKDIRIPQLSPSTPLTLDTVEGRSVLHDQCKLLHEKYIEYAHRVYVELKSHRKYLGEVVQDLEKQLYHVADKLKQAQEDSHLFESRIQRAFEKHRQLQERIRKCNKIPALRQRVLTVAEREFKALLDSKMHQDVEILQGAVESLTLRAERVSKRPSSGSVGYRSSPKVAVPESQMRAVKQALDRLGQYVDISGRRLEVLEQTVQRKEALRES